MSEDEPPQVMVRMFKAAINTKRFRANQKVWVKYKYANHMIVRHKWRGRGRYVTATMSCHQDEAPSLSAIKTIEVSAEFAKRHDLQIVDGKG